MRFIYKRQKTHYSSNLSEVDIFFLSYKGNLWVSRPETVRRFRDHQEPRLLLSCSSATFDTWFHFTVQDDGSSSFYHICSPASRKGDRKKSFSPFFKEITCDIFLCSFAPSGHLYLKRKVRNAICILCSHVLS